MTSLHDPWARRTGIALIAGPVTFVLTMGFEQALRPGFSILSNTISELRVDSHGWSYAWMFTGSIITLGLLTLVGAYGLTRIFGRPGRNGAFFLALSGLGCIGVGIFNYVGFLAIHSIFALDQFIMSGLALLFLARVFTKDNRWGPTYATFSRLCGIVVLISTMLFVVGVGGQDYNGLVERIIVAPALLWSVIAGLRLWHLPRLKARAALPPPSVGA